MFHINSPPREGDLYKIITIDGHTFELRFGYYADFERKHGDPVVIYPDLNEERHYTNDGMLIVTAVQDPCKHYEVPEHKARDECCVDCIHYSQPGDDIGICKCRYNHIKQTKGDTDHEE